MDVLGLNSKRMTSLVLVLMVLAAVWTFPSMAVAPSVDSIRPQVASLVSSPGRCEIKLGQQVCQMRLNLIWETPSADRYCLLLKHQDKPIKCWENAWRGSVEVSFSASKKTFYLLKKTASDTVVVQTGVSVTGNYKQRKRAQRRKRGFWRMF
jgi:hypothetical protein